MFNFHDDNVIFEPQQMYDLRTPYEKPRKKTRNVRTQTKDVTMFSNELRGMDSQTFIIDIDDKRLDKSLYTIENDGGMVNDRDAELDAKEPYTTKTTADNPPPTDLDPLIEYAEEPLLSLEEACAPLDSILHNLSFYVQMALDETPKEPPDDLTIDESAAIRLYSIEWAAPHRSLYSMLNYTLKTCPRSELQPYFKYMKLFLSARVEFTCVR
ncbi:unnamed protein product, partial [Adineta ricciae]